MNTILFTKGVQEFTLQVSERIIKILVTEYIEIPFYLSSFFSRAVCYTLLFQWAHKFQLDVKNLKFIANKWSIFAWYGWVLKVGDTSMGKGN